ncbi:MAG: hypothetical protein FD189_2586 [Elusimicrobia bacterium]|nr:MAG: hypothetical protein FD189_2586 [Elusimicrobiota bacterium]
MKKVSMAVVIAVMAGGAYAADFNDLGVKAAELEVRFPAADVAAPTVGKTYLTAGTPVEFVAIQGGSFIMGTGDAVYGLEDAKPAHEVAVRTFDMARTHVTVEQYAECVFNGACSEPASGDYCNWGKPDRWYHPVNCVDWNQAQRYARFKGARLPSEAEWEYAARSGGRPHKYPWGNAAPTRDLAVMNINTTAPVCSRPAGNTAQGLCDMAGNVWQWVQDAYWNSYEGAPVDGSAFEGPGAGRVLRGGAFYGHDDGYLRTDSRNYLAPDRGFVSVGFRIAKSR